MQKSTWIRTASGRLFRKEAEEDSGLVSKGKTKKRIKRKTRVILLAIVSVLLLLSFIGAMFITFMSTLAGAVGNFSSLPVGKRLGIVDPNDPSLCTCGCLQEYWELSNGGGSLASGYGYTDDTDQKGQIFNLYMSMLGYISKHGYDGSGNGVSLPVGALFERFYAEGARIWFTESRETLEQSYRHRWVDPSDYNSADKIVKNSTSLDDIDKYTSSDKSVFETLAVSQSYIGGEGYIFNAIALAFPDGLDKEPKTGLGSSTTAGVDQTGINYMGHSVAFWENFVKKCPQEVFDSLGVTVPTSIARGTTGNPLYIPDILWGTLVYFAEQYESNITEFMDSGQLDSALRTAIDNESGKALSGMLAYGIRWNRGANTIFFSDTSSGRQPAYNNFAASVFKYAIEGKFTEDDIAIIADFAKNISLLIEP